MGKSDQALVQSVMRALDIVEVLAESKKSLGVTQIAKLTGLYKPTAHRLLNTLVHAGYVQQESGESDYKLGMKILKISSLVLERQDIRELARPYLKKLSDSIKEIAHLAIMDVNEVVYIDKVENNEQTIRIFSSVGNRSPMHCTGLGKVLLAGLSDSEVKAIVAQKGLKKYTDNTITNLNHLKQELERIRERGYGFDEMEHELGVWCVASPVFDRFGRTIAAISVTTPSIYISDDRKRMLAHEVVNVTRELSMRLGYTKKEDAIV